MNKTIRIIDLFAGIGGTRLGCELAGKKLGYNVKCVFTSEIDKYAIKTYVDNFGKCNIYGDISLLKTKDISSLVPDHDLLVAGFPCQPFSQAGHKKGFDDTRGTLFFDIQRILEVKRPKMFLLENVKHLKGHDNGNTLKTILRVLRKNYYVPEPEVLTSKDFGVPQNRQRIFIVGFRLDNTNGHFEYPQPLNKITRLGDILESRYEKKYIISDRIWKSHKMRKKRNKELGKGFGYGLFDRNSEYANTISARYYTDGAEVLISRGEDKTPRRLLPRECARLQGFPESFKITVSDMQAYKQFGNSVSVPVIKHICINMIKFAYDVLESPVKKPAKLEKDRDFKNYKNMLERPFIVYADFECSLIPTERSDKIARHEPHSASCCFVFVCLILF